MTASDLGELIEQYRAGLQAEIALLHRVEVVALRQQTAAGEGDLPAIHAAGDEREQLMAGLVALEQQLSEVRRELSERRFEARNLPGFPEAVALHHEASALVGRILERDRESVEVLASAELSKWNAVKAVEKGETMLTAYRRVVAAPPAATLVDKRG